MPSRPHAAAADPDVQSLGPALQQEIRISCNILERTQCPQLVPVPCRPANAPAIAAVDPWAELLASSRTATTMATPDWRNGWKRSSVMAFSALGSDNTAVRSTGARVSGVAPLQRPMSSRRRTYDPPPRDDPGSSSAGGSSIAMGTASGSWDVVLALLAFLGFAGVLDFPPARRGAFSEAASLAAVAITVSRLNSRPWRERNPIQRLHNNQPNV
jgi:hypothetical protein